MFEQPVLEESSGCIVTFIESTPLGAAVLHDGAPILEPGSPVIWFTYPGEWHDLGLFHLVDGTFTGVYANILTPVRMTADRWETTDLCLDLWLDARGRISLRDEDEFVAAVGAGWIDARTAARARAHVQTLLREAERGSWPPPPVREWTLERARERIAAIRSS